MDRLPARDAAVLLGVTALWGFNFVPIRWALDDIPPLLLAATRFALAAVPLVAFVPAPRVRWPSVVGYGLAIGAGQFGLLFLAIRLGFPAGLASLLIQVQVFFTIGLSAWLTRDPVRPHQLAGAALAAVGLLALAVERGTHGSRLGLLLVLGAAASWALGNTMAKRAAQQGPLDMFALVVWSSLAAPLPLAAASWFLEGGTAAWSALAHAGLRAWASTLFMAYAATLVGFAAWNRMLHRHSAALVAPFALFVPVAGLLSAALVLHEPLSGVEAVAAALVLAGLAVTTGLGRRARPPPP